MKTSANRNVALCYIKKSPLKNCNSVVKQDNFEEYTFKNTRKAKSLSENKQTRKEYNQAEPPKKLNYNLNSHHFNLDENCKKMENKKSVLQNKHALWGCKQKASAKNFIPISSIHSRSGDAKAQKTENKKSVLRNKQSNKQTAPLNNFGSSLTVPRLVGVMDKKAKIKKVVSENKQSQSGQKQTAKDFSSIHELVEKDKKSPNKMWIPKCKQSDWIYTQTAHPKNMCSFSSSNNLNKKITNYKNREPVSESKHSVWRYNQTAPLKTVSYFAFLFI